MFSGVMNHASPSGNLIDEYVLPGEQYLSGCVVPSVIFGERMIMVRESFSGAVCGP